ncbi:hypothetical protein HPB52_013313 [Rhipicephalus sanguineus]|uniref:Uncharacterized protein n=1 Tax=Rhipicephalus sanguineus TaxID=34632 RepID=A0A9D4PRE7_RHISA|nr:hypothetical protein HPB52_013313 [Rhipicephalus sanguineus]
MITNYAERDTSREPSSFKQALTGSSYRRLVGESTSSKIVVNEGATSADAMNKTTGEISDRKMRKPVVRFGATTVYEITSFTLSQLTSHTDHFYALLGLAITFAAFWFSVVSSALCASSAECSSARESLDALMDPYVEPCADFHRHVCNKWMLDYNTDIVNTAQRDAIRVATDTLLSTGGPSTVAIPRAFRRFYTACYSFLATTSLPSLFAILEPLRIYADILYTDNFSVLLERAILLSLDQGIHVFLKLSLVNDTGRTSLQLSMANTLTENLYSEATEIDESFMLRALLDYALAGTSMRTSPATILKLDQMLSSRVESEPTLRLPITRIGEMIAFMDTKLWLRCLNSVLSPDAHFENDSLLVTADSRKIEHALTVLHSAGLDGRIYAYVQVLAVLARFYYVRQHGRAVHRATACFFAGFEIFGHAWTRMFLGVIGPPRGCARIEAIFSKLVQSAYEGSALAWLDRASRSSHLRVLRSVRLKLFDDNADDFLNSEQSWDESSEGFPSDFLRAKRKAQRRSFIEPTFLYTDLQDALLYRGRVAYARPLGAVVVPPTIAKWPFCYTSEEVPPEFDLGTVGYLMAAELVSAPFVHFPNGIRGLRRLTEIRRFANCIRPVADALMETPLSNLSQAVATEIFVRARAARLAFNALKEMGGVDAETGRLAQMTFFRRFCLLACNSGTQPEGLSSEARCLLPLANMPEFAKAFGCSSPSKMINQPCDVS